MIHAVFVGHRDKEERIQHKPCAVQWQANGIDFADVR